jgi:hypothetical protein
MKMDENERQEKTRKENKLLRPRSRVKIQKKGIKIKKSVAVRDTAVISCRVVVSRYNGMEWVGWGTVVSGK